MFDCMISTMAVREDELRVVIMDLQVQPSELAVL